MTHLINHYQFIFVVVLLIMLPSCNQFSDINHKSLLIQEGSNQANLWGINLYPDIEGKDWIEFDSIINIRPSQNNISRGVDNPQVREKMAKIIIKLVGK